MIYGVLSNIIGHLVRGNSHDNRRVDILAVQPNGAMEEDVSKCVQAEETATPTVVATAGKYILLVHTHI